MPPVPTQVGAVHPKIEQVGTGEASRSPNAVPATDPARSTQVGTQTPKIEQNSVVAARKHVESLENSGSAPLAEIGTSKNRSTVVQEAVVPPDVLPLENHRGEALPLDVSPTLPPSPYPAGSSGSAPHAPDPSGPSSPPRALPFEAVPQVGASMNGAPQVGAPEEVAWFDRRSTEQQPGASNNGSTVARSEGRTEVHFHNNGAF